MGFSGPLLFFLGLIHASPTFELKWMFPQTRWPLWSFSSWAPKIAHGPSFFSNQAQGLLRDLRPPGKCWTQQDPTTWHRKVIFHRKLNGTSGNCLGWSYMNQLVFISTKRFRILGSKRWTNRFQECMAHDKSRVYIFSSYWLISKWVKTLEWVCVFVCWYLFVDYGSLWWILINHGS